VKNEVSSSFLSKHILSAALADLQVQVLDQVALGLVVADQGEDEAGRRERRDDLGACIFAADRIHGSINRGDQLCFQCLREELLQEVGRVFADEPRVVIAAERALASVECFDCCCCHL
jgi:hypothetical protein